MSSGACDGEGWQFMGSESPGVQKLDWRVGGLGFEVDGGKKGVQHTLSSLAHKEMTAQTHITVEKVLLRK